MDYREEILSTLKGALKELGITGVEPLLEHPTDENHGDYSTNVAMMIFRKVPSLDFARDKQVSKAKGWKTPLELAEAITDAIRKTQYAKRWLGRIETAPPGFINFWLSKEAFGKELELAIKDGEQYGEGDSGAGKKILVEFAHPNTHKLFHIGHLRNITLGESISRLLESQQAEVNRANYQGDIGLHIAKALWGIKKLGLKKLKTLDEKIRFLAEAYVLGNKGYEESKSKREEVEEINKRLYEKDVELTKLWEETRKWSLEYFDQIYKRVGTKFDRLYFESEAAEPGRKLVLDSLGKVFKEDQGAVIFPGEEYGLHNRVFINKFGLPTYEAKDLGLAELQLKEFSPDRIIHVVGPEQKGYFEVVFKAIEMVFPELSGVEHHLAYGWVRLKTGKMSSRKGDVVEGEWLLDETKKRLKEKYEMPEEAAEKVAVGAVKYSMLRLHPLSEIAFDIEESIRLDGDSGPYLQYTHARCRSVLEKSSHQVPGSGLPVNQSTGQLIPDTRYPIPDKLEPEELALLRYFYKFPEVVQEAAEKFSPNLVCNFLFELAQRYNAFYNKHRILGSGIVGARRHNKHRILESGISNLEFGEKEPKILNSKFQIQSFRLALTEVTGNILKTGLGLLGIHAPEKM